MEGVVDFHLRKIYAAIGGIDLCVTEFIRVTQTVLPRHVFIKSCPELLEQNQRLEVVGKKTASLPIRIQLLGSDPKLLGLNAQKAAELGAIGIDLNFGCPAKGVNRNRGGACLLDETELIKDIVKSVRDAVPNELPVTAKIRLGYENRNSYLDNAKAIADAGASELVVHARSKSDGYKPPAYWHYCADIRNAINIPVIANGEIWTVEDYQRCVEQSECENVMLGRGLLANPFLAHEIRESANTSATNITAKSDADKEQNTMNNWTLIAPLLLAFFEETSQAYPAKFMGNRVKQWLHYLQRHHPQAEQLFQNIKKLRDYEGIRSAIKASY
ncbi:tRNA dihydrouridine synthase [Agaribacterium sp. ZY112]|uniref:tRNA dihydrouridine synthase n=1 Tax=Agaribacterium sp. ZY112 TaxID=3233574 RepID=UPI0035266C8A